MWLTIAFGLLTFASLVTICCFEQVNRPKKGQYAMPLVPSLPCVSIFFNFVLVTSLEAVSWVIFGVMISVGLLVYFVYGFRNSKLNIPKTAALASNKENDDSNQSSYNPPRDVKND